jgi:hypothetical protein
MPKNQAHETFPLPDETTTTISRRVFHIDKADSKGRY